MFFRSLHILSQHLCSGFRLPLTVRDLFWRYFAALRCSIRCQHLLRDTLPAKLVADFTKR